MCVGEQPVCLSEVAQYNAKPSFYLILIKSRACFSNCARVAIDRGNVGTGCKKGGAVSAAPQCTIENRSRLFEYVYYLIREHRRVIGAVPRARCPIGHLQNLRIWSSTAGV